MSNLTDTAKEFEEKRVTIVRNGINPVLCKKLTDNLFALNEAGEGLDPGEDPQCPKSIAFYGHPILETLADQMTDKFSSLLGLDLASTYVYSRIYLPGEELKIHRDRPSCEISATVTLGYEGDLWPIYYSYQEEDKDTDAEVKVMLEPGDMMWYHGCEIYHWRNEYTEGNWQAQMFFHYVDLNGPNQNMASDGRSVYEKYYRDARPGKPRLSKLKQ